MSYFVDIMGYNRANHAVASRTLASRVGHAIRELTLRAGGRPNGKRKFKDSRTRC